MTRDEPARIGMHLQDVSTPALIIDLDALERNLKGMADDIRQHKVRLRPHAKTHKSPDIALRQMALGAVGSCCQTVAEAEALVRGGVGNVLVSNQVVGSQKLERLSALAKHATVGVCVDNSENVTALSGAAQAANVTINVLVEIDVGMGRCGVPPGAPAVELAKHVNDADALRFEGIQAYHGRAQHIRDHEERRCAIQEATAFALETVELLAATGIECQTVAGAGTGTYPFEAASRVYNELQAGSYVFMDADYGKNLTAEGKPFTRFEHSLFVLSSVISVPQTDRVVLDAGLKAHSVDSGLPLLADFTDITYFGPSDEHGNLDLSRSNHRFALGDHVRLVPGHCDPTVNLYDWFIGVRENTVECLWPVAARGPGS